MTFTVALIGPDGAGKSTIGRRLEQELSLPAKYIYMGINLDAGNLMLPTTRMLLAFKRARGNLRDMAGPPDPNRRRSMPRNPVKRAARELKSLLRMTNLMAEEWYRQCAIWYFQRRGYVVLCDRHFFPEYYAHDIDESNPDRPLARRLHGSMLRRIYPRPDLVINFDAPAEVLFARKGEGSVELLELRREEYRRIGSVIEHYATVDVAQTEDEVTRDVAEIIRAFEAARRSG